MCTAISFLPKEHYFGRNFDLDISYGEKAVITPRNYPFEMRKLQDLEEHYAMIGMAAIFDDVPLYYDAVNEYGLGMAGLNFEGNAVFLEEDPNKLNVAPFEFIPYVLGQCKTVAEARDLIEKINLVNIPFSDQLPLSPLHWIVTDKEQTLVVEPLASGLKIYDDPIGVLTNNPTFDKQLATLSKYRGLSAKTPENTFAPDVDIPVYSRGMGTFGLPGDLTSSSRFARAAFTKAHALCDPTEMSCVSQCLHILDSVNQTKGCCELSAGHFEYTIYSVCYNTAKGLLYYTTYDNRQLTALDLHKVDLTGTKPTVYPLLKEQSIKYQN